ncbi:MAG TPA: hypothetical protein VGA07_01000 [Anaerolineales bacterium]
MGSTATWRLEGDAAAADRHAAAVGIGEGDLGVAAFIHALLQAFVLLHALLEQSDLLLELLGRELRLFGFFGVVGIQFIQVGFDLAVDLLEGALELAVGEVARPAVDRLELGTVDGHQVPTEEIQVPAEGREAAADLLDGRAIVPAEVGDGLKVGGELAGEPHDLHVALGFALEHAAGADAVEIAIDVELQEHGRMVGWEGAIMASGVTYYAGSRRSGRSPGAI